MSDPFDWSDALSAKFDSADARGKNTRPALFTSPQGGTLETLFRVWVWTTLLEVPITDLEVRPSTVVVKVQR